jgi:hypothetical protein
MLNLANSVFLFHISKHDTYTVWAYDQKDNSQSASFLHPLLLIQLKIILKFDIVNLINVY